MAEFLYAWKNTNEELRNAKSNQNIRGQPLVRLVLFYLAKKTYILSHHLYGWIFVCWQDQYRETEKCKI